MRPSRGLILSSASALAILAMPPGPAFAQSNGAASATASGTAVEEVIVTGSSIKGVAPIGSNLVAVGREELAKTAAVNATELTNTVPAISTAGSAPVGQNAFSYYSPQIHSLAGSASNTTLVLVDSMRMAGGGTQFAQTDPNIIPTSAIARVEVLADGASSVYGSDAVAGVVNYITRKSFSGIEFSARFGTGDHFRSTDLNGIAGATWGTGGVYVAAQYSDQSPVANSARDFLSMGDYRSIGGRNVQSFTCSPATIRTPASGSNFYLNSSATATIPNDQNLAPCNLTQYASAIPGNKRENVLVKVNDTYGKLTVSGFVNYNHLYGQRSLGPGTLANITVFGPGSGKAGQINPFYTAPAGDPNATQEIISYAAIRPDNQYGSGIQENDTFYASGYAEYQLTDNLSVRLSDSIGHSRSSSLTRGAFCPACAILALNGTTQSGGSTTGTSVPGANVVALNTPLTATNALDVWNATNRSTQTVLNGLYTNNTATVHYNDYNQVKLEAQGTLFQLPAGDMRFAVGGEYVKYIQKVEGTDASGVGSTNLAATYRLFNLGRNVYSAYVELVAPIVSEEMAIPMVRSLDVNISGRYDNYSDVGATTNPKFAVNWEPFNGVKLRGNYATAFVAPPLASIGDPRYGYQRSATGAGIAASVLVPVVNYPTITQLPGCATATVTCLIGSGVTQGLSRSYGVGPTARPQTGNSYSLGLDLAPSVIPDFSANLTFWSNTFKGGVNRPDVGVQVNQASLRNRLTLCPTGCTQAQIDDFTHVATGGTLSAVQPATVYFLVNNDQGNLLNLRVQGLDMNFNYLVDTDSFGVFDAGLSGTYYTKYDQDYGDQVFSVLNTSGYNSSFPNIQMRLRGHLGWSLDGFSIDGWLNYTGKYHNWSNTTVIPLILDKNGNPIGGGDVVRADQTIDLHAAYAFSTSYVDHITVYVDIKNLFDRNPPFYSGNTAGIDVGAYGYNGYVSNPINRLVSAGVNIAL